MELLGGLDITRYQNKTSYEEKRLIYKGPFDSQSLADLGLYIRRMSDDNYAMRKRLYFIFMELAQNISFYSAVKHREEEKSGVGMLIIQDEVSHYEILTGNYIRNKDRQKLEEKAGNLRAYDREQLRKYKREMRKRNRGDIGNANIGLIEVALMSDGPVALDFKDIDDEKSFFVVSLQINKNQ